MPLKKKNSSVEEMPEDSPHDGSDEEDSSYDLEWEDDDDDDDEEEDEEEEDEEEEDEEEEDDDEGDEEAEDDDEDDDANSESVQADEEKNSEESEEGEEEENELNVPKIRLKDLLANKKGKLVTMNYCTKHLYKGPIENIRNMLNGSALKEFEIKEEAPDKNEPAFKNVSRKWGWKQEVMLLEGIEAHGHFNWEVIAAQMSQQSGRNFKAEEIKNHYYQYYLKGTLGQVWDYELDEAQVKCFDHTDPIVICSTNKYLPSVAPKNLREIKFLPHREDFGIYPTNEIEKMLTRVDFSSYYMNALKALKIDQEVRNLQLAIVDAYRNVVADRKKLYKLMKDFKLIEQFFNMDGKITKKCEVDKYFSELQKFARFFDSPDEFINFYFDCVKEKLLKLEIARLYQALASRKKKERDPEMKVMLKKRAPDCFSILTKILYCKGLKSGRKNSSLPGEKEHANVMILAHPTLFEGIKMNMC